MKKSATLDAETLKSKRISLRLERSEMAEALNTAISTYNDWESGRIRIPGIVIVALRALEREEKYQIPKAVANIMAMIERNHPAGIV